MLKHERASRTGQATVLDEDTVRTGEAGLLPDAAIASPVSWGAIFAGAVAAAGLSIILLFVGAGLGLSAASPWSRGGAGVAAIGIWAILWLSLTQILASWLGGYLAGRLRRKWVRVHDHEVTFRDTAHGFVAWALATVVTALISSSVVGSVVTGGVQAASNVAGTAATAAVAGAVSGGAAATHSGNGAMNGSMDYFSDMLLRSTAGAAPANTRPLDPNERAEVTRILGNAVRQGGLSGDDSRYLGQLVFQHTGLPPDQATQRVNSTFSALQERLRGAENQAKQAADKARRDTAYTALWFAIVLFMGAFVASLSATFGGRTRDRY